MLDETKTLTAKEIVNNSDDVITFERPYVLVRDDSITGRFDNLLEALAILKERGWDVNQMTYTGTSVLVLLDNTYYKRKNS